MRFTRRLLLASLGLAFSLGAGPSMAQDYPARPIKLVIPQAPGSGADAVGRMLADFMSRDLKQSVVVDNKPGANGIIASQMVQKEAADGYTLLLTSVSLVSFNQFLYKNVPYDPLKDFTFVAPVSDASFVLVASTASGIKSWDDLVKKAKANPDSVTYASAGTGNSTHLYTEMIALRSGMKLRHIPYKSSGPALMAVVGGETDVMTVVTATGLAQIKSGKVVGLAQSGDTRSPQLPNLPLIKELAPNVPALPGWYALVGPAKMDARITQKLAASVNHFLSDPAMKQKLIDQFLFPIPGTPADIQKRAESEAKTWGGLIRDLKIQLD
ncbi:tripartite tricarboxylate transporter substrate binding protein [Ramlibacter sp.]|uniref:Bug family tripartite tricarboxylate transporter substrate binding protein n=1 Tax=Ramlibacter sp. TaxID=1917967 RepID=UPI002D0A69BC|nr:tripartite tricarboxylate transporter substrate binding protein [Ramlibacter sp.]HWI82210.1 tripartite tricarboxylate transporter substrate binding protein [Ramlibacter sp.]